MKRDIRFYVPRAIALLLTSGIVACLALLGYFHIQERNEADSYRAAANTYTAPTLKTVPLNVSEEQHKPEDNPPTAEQSSVFSINADFEALTEVNDDICAWLSIPGTSIDYPVLQCSNNSAYLRTGFDGKWSRSGSAFFDCKIDLADNPEVYMVYGHAMSAGSELMFSPLLAYTEREFYDAHPSIYLAFPPEYSIDGVVSNTDSGSEYAFQIFSVCVVDAFSDTEIAEHYCLSFSDTISYESYIDNLRAQSLYEIPIESVPERVIALSTCANPGQSSDYRLVIYGGLFQTDAAIIESTE